MSYLTDAYTRAQRRAREEHHTLQEEVACIEDPTGVLLAPTANIRLTKFASTTVATPEGGEWLKSNVVLDRGAWC